MQIQFQTSDLVPPPYAYAIEISLNKENDLLKMDFELTYLDREGMDISDILDEGFSEEDDLKWTGELSAGWLDDYENVCSGLYLSKKSELRSGEDFWHIKYKEKQGYPENKEQLSFFIQELQQAAFEASEREAPLKISIHRISNTGQKKHIFKASFKDRIFDEEVDGKSVKHDWAKLNPFLKDLFSGEFRPDQARKNLPKKSGLFINLGDDLWYELGKSYLIQPSKIQQYLS